MYILNIYDIYIYIYDTYYINDIYVGNFYSYTLMCICYKYLHCFPMCISQPISLLGSFIRCCTLGVMGLCPSKSPWPQTPEGLAWEGYLLPGEQ